MHRCQVILILLASVLVAGCASIRGNEQFTGVTGDEKKVRIAVMPFRSAPDVRESGRIISDILANQLHALGRYFIVAPEVVENRLAEQDDEFLSPAKAGELSGAPYIIEGSVAEYTYKAGVGETPVVGITARLIKASSGEILWSATRTGTGGGSWFHEESLSRLTVMVCKEIADRLNIFLQEYLLKDGLGRDKPRTTQNTGSD